QRVYRLDDAGIADLVLGAELNEDQLSKADSAAIDVLGRTLVQDQATRAVHVFDPEGRRVAICRLAPAERPASSYEGFGGNRDGSVWVKMGKGLARFDAAGTRLPADAEHARPDDTDADPALKAIKVRPDGSWLERDVKRAVLPDGRRVILEAP